MQIVTFGPHHAQAFRELNEQWIREYFCMEEPDFLVLGDPETHIVRRGGHIFMVMDGEVAVGCCALLSEAPGVFELGKMTVAKTYRGRGIGRTLLEHTIAAARRAGAEKIMLGTNRKLREAIHLYEALGFRPLTPDENPSSLYSRADLFMELQL